MAEDKRSEGTRYRVVTAYVAQFDNPLRLGAGDRVTVGREDTDYPGWFWCTSADGNIGWAPADCLRDEGGGVTAAYDYSAVELTVKPGDELLLVREYRGWVLCMDAKGRQGWIPAANVEPRS